MLCPKCSGKSSVVESRTRNKTTWRKRHCPKCKYNYRTLEVLEKPKSKEPPKLFEIRIKPKTKTFSGKTNSGKVWKPKPKERMFELEHLTDEELEGAVMSGQVRFDEDEL